MDGIIEQLKYGIGIEQSLEDTSAYFIFFYLLKIVLSKISNNYKILDKDRQRWYTELFLQPFNSTA